MMKLWINQWKGIRGISDDVRNKPEQGTNKLYIEIFEKTKIFEDMKK